MLYQPINPTYSDDAQLAALESFQTFDEKLTDDEFIDLLRLAAGYLKDLEGKFDGLLAGMGRP